MARQRLMPVTQGVLSGLASHRAWSWLVSLCFMYQHLKVVNLRKSSRAKIGRWWADVHKVLYLTVILTSVSSVTTHLRLISDFWCAVLRENTLQLFTATLQNTHLTLFERFRVPTDTRYILQHQLLSWYCDLCRPSAALIVMPGEKRLSVTHPWLHVMCCKGMHSHSIYGKVVQGKFWIFFFFFRQWNREAYWLLHHTSHKCKSPSSFSISAKQT